MSAVAGRILALLLVPLAGAPAAAQQLAPGQADALRYRHIGPVGNRVSAVAGVPGDPEVYYAGAASGGIWKTTDGGLVWQPVFDDQDVHAIGALAVAPSDPAIVWAGTGEPHIRSNVTVGDGVYRSLDGGETWTNMGLRETGRISRVIVHPTDPDIVYVASLGHTHAPQRERGIYRTLDGGRTWEQVLFVDEDTGASDLVMDPHNPRKLFAGMWTVSFNTWGRESGGPGSGIYMSRDGGTSWTRLAGNGLPRLPVGKVGLCVTPADSDRIYALIETGDGVPWRGQDTESGELWRSDDGGRSWRLMTHDRSFGGRTGYYNRCAASTDDPDEAYFLTAAFTRTIDGGRTGITETGIRRPGGDFHDMWIDPGDGDRFIIGNDQGLGISTNRGASYLRVQLPIAQMYHVTADNAVPYHVMGNRQDGPSARGPSNSRAGGRIPRGEWVAVGGGESGFATPDPEDPDIVWSSASGSGARGGIVVRWNARTGQFRHVEVWPESTGGWPAEELRYRFQWTFPLLVSPHDRNTLYVTSQHVHRTSDGGQSWQEISPDLTTNDKSKQGISGGLTPDNIGVEYCCVIYAFDESPARAGVLWAGSNDGRLHVSRDGGGSWTDVTGNLPDLPPLGTFRSIDASRWEEGKAYVTVERHQLGDFSPYVYRTSDFGRTWTKITAGIPEHPNSFARYLLEDPVRPGLLYLGTENQIWVSFDDGARWQSLRGNMPPAPIYGLVVQEDFDDLVVGTYGRGFWILDDITPLQQLTAEVAAAPAHLFRPRHAYRLHGITSPMTMPNDPSDGENPPEGASLNYWLGRTPAGPVRVRIADAGGNVIRTLTGTRQPGLNRVWWDLETEPTTQMRLRTKPLYAEWVDLGDDRWRPAPEGRFSLLAPPGTYTITLEVDGRSYSESLEVRKDPGSEGTLADIELQQAMLRQLRDDINRGADMVNRIEWVRRQLQDLAAVLADQGGGGAAGLVASARELEAKLIAVEEELLQLRLTGTGQDGVRWPVKVMGRLGYLANTVQTADFRPTDQAREVQAVLEEQLRAQEARLAEILRTDLPAFNRVLAQQNVAPVISDAPGG